MPMKKLWLAMGLHSDVGLEHAPGSYGSPAKLVLPDGCVGVMFVYGSREAADADNATVMEVFQTVAEETP